MSETVNDLIQWKKLWQLVSGKHFRTPQETVREKLLEITKELQDGILQFKQATEKPVKTLESVMTGQEKWLPFTRDLQKFLNLDAVQTWEILCYYLVNEYRGSASSLSTYIASESSKLKLLLDIWGYYSLERIVMLKTVKHLLEYCATGNNPYSDEYMAVVTKIGLKNLRKSYITQFKHLLNDVIPIKTIPGDILTSQQKLVSWSERNLREMKEILQIILLTIDLDGFEIDEMKQLFELFRSHSFGRQHNYLDATNEFHNDLIRKVTYSEIAIILRAFDISDKPAYDDQSWIVKMRDSLERDVMAMHQYPEHGPVLLIWMLFNFRLANAEDEDLSNRYRQFGSRAVQLDVFNYLLGMIQDKMYEVASVARIVRKSVYNHLAHLCELFDADGSVAKHRGVFELLCELLQTTSLAIDFVTIEDSPVRSLFSTAVESFPVDFVPLTMIANVLASKNTTTNSYIRDFLENLPYYTEIDGNGRFQLRPAGDIDDEFILLNDYAPFPKIDFCIKASSRAVVMDKKEHTLIHFRTPLNYFDVLHHEINQLLAHTTSYSEIDEAQLQRVTAGIDYLAKAVRRIENANDISSEMVHPTEMVFDIMVKFKGTQNPPIALLANCMDVCSALVKLFDEEIFNRIVSINVLPTLNRAELDFRALANGRGFEPGLVGVYLVNCEKATGRYGFLLAYLNFLKVYSKLAKNNVRAVELPGLLFVLREIFPHIQSWRFEDEQDRLKIVTAVLQYLFEVLQVPADDQARVILRNVCVYSLLNLDNGMMLLRFVGIGNPRLQTAMANETNWVQAANTGLNKIVQLSLTILMQILRLKSHVLDDTGLSALETIIYTQPKQHDHLRIIPNVTSYMNNIFERRLPILACRLLRRFAMEFHMSLLACLDMENDQIRLMFLQRLRDDMESDDLKIGILEFVEACIDKQPGLTEAFFEVTYEDRRFLGKMRAKKSIAEGILVYMRQYLDAISTDAAKLASPLLSRIMSLFHALWKNNMQSLVQELLDQKDFWSSLCNPLFAPSVNNDLRAYTQLFYILGIEAFKVRRLAGDIDASLKTVFDKFLKVDVFTKWTNIVFDLPQVYAIDRGNKDEVPEWLCRLQSFKDLLVLLLQQKTTSPIKVPDDCKKVLADRCLEALIKRSECTDDLRPFVVLAELYLLVLLQFERKYTASDKEDVALLGRIEKLLNALEVAYAEHHTRAKKSLLAIFIKSIDLLSDTLAKDPEAASRITGSVVNIVANEIYTLEAHCREEIKTAQPLTAHTKITAGPNEMSTLLSLNLLNRLILVFDEHSDMVTSAWGDWFLHNKICNRLLSCLNVILPIYAHKQVSQELLGVLVLIAKSEFSRELLFVDIGEYMWLKLLPPKDLFNRSYAASMETDGVWESQDWWPIYSKGIELVRILLQKHKYCFLEDAIFFIGVHEEYLMDSLLLAKQALDKNAIALIRQTLELICEVSLYGREWRMEHGQSVMNLIKCIQILTEHLITLLFCPKILKRLIDGPNVALDDFRDLAVVDVSEELVPVMNELIEIVTLCAKCLLNFSPKLINLICDTEFETTQWFQLIEIQFGPPKINSETYPQLSFGSMLKAVGLLTKSLHLQHHNFSETPLNKLPGDDDNTTIANLSESNVLMQSMTGQSTPPSSRKTFSKSLSMTSTTSVVSTTQIQPSNDLLTRLDCKRSISALEFILSLLASQSLLALKGVSLSDRDEQFKQLLRRELKTELSTFHDLVKKRIMRDGKCNWSRRKYGISLMKNLRPVDDGEDDDDEDVEPVRQSVAVRSSTASKSLRAQVTRKNWQQQLQTPAPAAPAFNMSKVYSPIGESTPLASTSSAVTTPPKGILKPHSSTALKRHVVFEDDTAQKKTCNEDEPIFFEPEDPVFTGLSFVKIVEEDYFHFLSNLFGTICHTEN